MVYLSENYGISDKYLYLENQLFKNTDTIKQIKIYPPQNGKCNIIIIYEIPDVETLPDNSNYLSIDLGLHNLMTCYNSVSGEAFIVGRKYLSICHYYNKEMARVQSQWYYSQSKNGIKYPKTSKHIKRLQVKKNNTINDYLHKTTRYIVNYCKNNNINTVVIGDITNIRKDKNYGNITNQQLHGLPYAKIYTMLGYKLVLEGINFVVQKELYSSQCSPLAPEVSKKYAIKTNRKHRGLYVDNGYKWNADSVGAFNILRLYLKETKKLIELNAMDIKNPYITKVAV